jgi:heat shock protein HslJ
MIKRLAMSAALIMLVVGMPFSAGAAAAEGLANTNWVLAEYVAQGSAAVTALGEPPPTLLFGDNGTVRGYTICNSYSGPYSEAGDQVTFGPLASTRRACTNPEFVAQERVMMQVLDGTTTVMRSGDKLVITAPAGSLTFVASDGSDLADPPEIPPTPGMPTTGQPGPDWSLLTLLALAPGIILFGVYLRRAKQTR